MKIYWTWKIYVKVINKLKSKPKIIWKSRLRLYSINAHAFMSGVCWPLVINYRASIDLNRQTFVLFLFCMNKDMYIVVEKWCLIKWLAQDVTIAVRPKNAMKRKWITKKIVNIRNTNYNHVWKCCFIIKKNCRH